MFKIKDAYKLEIQTPGTIFFGSTQKNNRPNKKGENVPSPM